MSIVCVWKAARFSAPCFLVRDFGVSVSATECSMQMVLFQCCRHFTRRYRTFCGMRCSQLLTRQNQGRISRGWTYRASTTHMQIQ